MQDTHNSLTGKDLTKLRFPFGPDFQAILSLIGDAVVSTDHTDRIILFNRAAEALFGYSASDALGRPLDILIPARFRDQHRKDHSRFFAVDAELRRTMAAGREVLGRRKDGTELAIEVSLSRQLIDGQQIGTAIIRDVSDRKVGEKQRQLLTDEVAHRLRNTMAVINSIVTLTARNASSAADFKTMLLGRFAAISRTNESLIRHSWIEASLRELLDSELAPYRSDDDRITLEGPDTAIDREVAVAMALVFHELATNASKYGALSVATGRLEVRWRVVGTETRVLEVLWQETGGPVVVPPTRRGFGSDLIANNLRGHGGMTELSYPVTGVTCSLSLPLA